MRGRSMMAGSTLIALIHESASTHGTRVAVRDHETTLTYRALAVRAQTIARGLSARGVGPGDLVAVCLPRSARLVVAALGALRAGAAYLPMDPAYPVERLGWMLRDSQAALLLTDSAAAERLAGVTGTDTIVLGRDGQLSPASDQASTLPGPPASDEIAYVVYTSGSTGQPKGVMVEHASLENLVAWHRTTFELSSSDVTTLMASPGFDASVWEIWPSLATGAAIHVVPDPIRTDPLALRDWLVAEAVTVSFVPTAMAEGLVALEWPPASRLRVMLTGGDALTRRPRAGLGFTLVNNYGLSETTVVATSGPVTAEGDETPSIGRPIPGVKAEVVDDDLGEVGVGEAGELLLGGTALARGYLFRPELTAERFVETARGRRYRTGDRVRLRADGELEFMGRLDDQLSVRGFRVEPGEVARALNRHQAVQSSTVLGRGASGSERQLVAYLQAAGPERPHPEELARFVSSWLPDYMVPAHYIWLDDVPLTAHGKVDRKALAQAAARDATEAPSDLGGTVAGLVAELLGVDRIDPSENFFLVGGHSLLGAQLIARLEERFGVEISLRYLFDHPTPAEIGAELSDLLDAERNGNAVAG